MFFKKKEKQKIGVKKIDIFEEKYNLFNLFKI